MVIITIIIIIITIDNTITTTIISIIVIITIDTTIIIMVVIIIMMVIINIITIITIMVIITIMTIMERTRVGSLLKMIPRPLGYPSVTEPNIHHRLAHTSPPQASSSRSRDTLTETLRDTEPRRYPSPSHSLADRR